MGYEPIIFSHAPVIRTRTGFASVCFNMEPVMWSSLSIGVLPHKVLEEGLIGEEWSFTWTFQFQQRVSIDNHPLGFTSLPMGPGL